MAVSVAYGLYQQVRLGLVLRCGVVVGVEQVHAVANKAGQADQDHIQEKQYVLQTWAVVNILFAQAERLQ